MGLITLTAQANEGLQGGYSIRVNTALIVGFVPSQDIPGTTRIYVIHGQFWPIPNGGGFHVQETPAAIAAMFPAVLKLTANNPDGPTGYTFYLNPAQIIGFSPDAPTNPGKARVYVNHGPYWRLGDGSFPVDETPTAIAAMPGW